MKSADYGVILLSRNIGKINKQGILVQKVTADLTKTSARDQRVQHDCPSTICLDQ